MQEFYTVIARNIFPNYFFGGRGGGGSGARAPRPRLLRLCNSSIIHFFRTRNKHSENANPRQAAPSLVLSKAYFMSKYFCRIAKFDDAVLNHGYKRKIFSMAGLTFDPNL